MLAAEEGLSIRWGPNEPFMQVSDFDLDLVAPTPTSHRVLHGTDTRSVVERRSRA